MAKEGKKLTGLEETEYAPKLEAPGGQGVDITKTVRLYEQGQPVIKDRKEKEERIKSDKDNEEGREVSVETPFEFKVEGRDFHIERKLGEGGMGEVFLAREVKLRDKITGKEELGSDVVIKIIKSGKEKGLSQDDQKRFEREYRAQIAAGDANVQNCIVPVHDVVDVEYEGIKTKGIIMKYMKDGDLGDIIRDMFSKDSEKELSHEQIESLISFIATQVCHALQTIHDGGMIHRDIKPGNIFISKDGKTIKLGDFGLIVAMEHVSNIGKKKKKGEDETISQKLKKLGVNLEETDESSIKGALGYLSPEALEGAPANSGFDLYALGASLYEMRTGFKALPGKVDDEIMARVAMKTSMEIPSIKEKFGADYQPSFLDHIIETLIKKDPEQRKEIVRGEEIKERGLFGREKKVVVQKRYSLETAEDIANTIEALAKKEGISLNPLKLKIFQENQKR